MKEKLSRMWRSGLALLLAICMLVGVCPVTAFATESESKEINYVSLGDSMTNGYGLTGYDNNGYQKYGEESYANQFADWLVDNGYADEVNHSQLALAAMRAEDLHFILEYGMEGAYVGDYYTYDEFTDGRFVQNCGGVEAAATTYQTAVTNADIVSIGCGNSNFGVFLLGRIMNAIGFSRGDDSWIELETALSECDPEIQEAALQAYDLLKAELAATDLPAELAEPMVDAITYTMVSYMLNYGGVIERIVELNPDAEIIIVGLMNTMNGMEFNYNGQTYDLGDYMYGALSVMNAYLAALPTVLQAAGKYPEATFYYAESPNVDVIVNNYGDMIYDELTPTIRNRFITEIVGDDGDGMVWELMGGMVPNMMEGAELVNISREEIEAYENMSVAEKAGYAGANMNKALSIALYLAFEDAIVASSHGATLSFEGLVALGSLDADLFSGVAENFGANITTNAGDYTTTVAGLGIADPDTIGKLCMLLAMPETMSAALQSDETVFGLLNLFARCLIGNGLGAHPSAAGHDTLANAVETTYANGYTAKDKTHENALIALDEIAKLLEQYGPEILEGAYSYAEENGYVEALETALATLQDELATQTENFVTYVQPDIEAAIEALQTELETLEGQHAALLTELEAKKTELEELYTSAEAGAEAAITELESLISDMEAAIETLETSISDIEDAITALTTDLSTIETELGNMAEAVETLAGALESLYTAIEDAGDVSIETAVSAYETAREAALIAVEAVDTIYGTITTALESIAGTAETVITAADSVLTFTNDVLGDMATAIDSLPENVKAALEASAEAVITAAEEAAAAVWAQADIDIAALETELAETIAQLEADAAAAGDEILAAAETQIAELESQIADLQTQLETAAEDAKAEIEAQIADLEAQIETIAADAQAAAETAVAEATAALEEQIATVTAEIEAQIEAVKTAAEDAVATLMADAEAEAEALLNAIDSTLADFLAQAETDLMGVIESASTIIAEELLPAAAEDLAELLGDLAEDLTDLIDDQVTTIVDNFNAAYYDATHGDYTVTEDSLYVALGDSSAVSESYVDTIAAELGVDYENLAVEGLTITDTPAVLAENAETIAKADLITFGYTNNTFTDHVAELVGLILSDKTPADIDWSAYLNSDGVAVVEAAMDELYAELMDAGMDATYPGTDYTMAAILTLAIECYAYDYITFACTYPEVVNAVHAINPEALVILVGMYNPLDGVVLTYENTEINVGDYMECLVELTNLHYTAYAMLTPNTIFVDAPDVQTSVPAGSYPAIPFLTNIVINGTEELLPTEYGHQSIAADILDALNVQYAPTADPDEPVIGLLGDANGDGIVDSFDASLILQYDLGIPDVTLDLSVCDVSGDGVVDSYDATLILQYDLGMITTFPAAN